MPADEADVVPIETLLYGGRDALRRAIALKGEIETAIRSGETARLADLLREVFDLVGLGIAGTP